MRYRTPGFACAVLSLVLTACGGGDGGSNPPPLGGGNTPPTANAGANQTVSAGVLASLNGSLSSDADGTIASYAWTQTAGTAVTLSSAGVAQPTFTAPAVVAATTLTFSLVVTDNGGATSAASTVTITVNPLVAGQVNVTGTVTFARVPFSAASPFGLNYGATNARPARAVTVLALTAGTTTEIARTSTGTDGAFTLSVPANSDLTIQVQAVMLRDGSQALPRWNVRVQDGTAGNSPYSYSDNVSFNSNTAGSRDISIPTGISAGGTASGARSSGPFAILDTIYQAMQTVVTAAPTTNFPTVLVDWGAQAGGTFFSGGNPQHIALLSDLSEDTDEFDQHVIAHEFGHYLEFNFSRADNIGGDHALGDRLDMRVAFGEGWGYAFAAIAMNDTNARDSYVQSGVQRSGGFDIQRNPTTPAMLGDGIGCWCSESSVWSILYDLYDNTTDANDNVALGFTPIWNVLVGPQRTTPAMTSIFSFITALKNAGTNENPNINTLVGAQNIVSSTIDAFATTETNSPSAAILPLFRTITVGAPQVVRNIDDFGDPAVPSYYNKAGNHNFLRFLAPTTRTYNFSVSTSNPDPNADPDFRVFREGDFVSDGTSEDGPSQPETASIDLIGGATYILDVYDCANGCSTIQGTAGDYDLTVTIN